MGQVWPRLSLPRGDQVGPRESGYSDQSGGGTTPGSRAGDDALCPSDGGGGAGFDSMSSAAQVTSLAALRLLAIFRTLCASACTTYSLPILIIE